jgi:tripartite-type tricarboxylate transporter receptor subunit TctC
LPAIAADLPGFESISTYGIFAPAKTPPAIINKLHEEIVRALNRPDVKEKFLASGQEAISSTPEEYAAFIKEDMARMGKVIKAAGIREE